MKNDYKNFCSYKILDDFRNKMFFDKWPTIPQMFEITCSRFPDKVAFRSYYPENESYTFSQAQSIIKKNVNVLRSKGLQEGDKIAVCGKNSPQWAMAYLSVLYAGCVVVPLDVMLNKEEVTNLGKFAEIKFAFADSDRCEYFDELSLIDIVKLDENDTQKEHLYFLDFAKHFSESAEKIPSNMSATAAILFTSGTTGFPKGVVLSHSNLISDCFYAQGNMEIFSSDVFYALLPIHHAYSMIAAFLVPVTQGSEIIFGKRIVSKQIFSDVKQGGVSIFLGVPALFNKIIVSVMAGIRKKGIVVYGFIKFLMSFIGLIDKIFSSKVSRKVFKFITKKISMDRIRICISGGGPLPVETFKRFNQIGIDFVQGYGMTETSPIITLNPIYKYKVKSVGKVIENTEVKIINKDNDGNGEICVRGEIVMQGYYKNPESTALIMDSDGFLNTGDIGHLDNENYLYLTGRAKNIIVTSGGKNVFPEEIEDEFQLYDDIDQIMIAGYKQDDDSEGIQAIVHPSEALTKRENNDKNSIRTVIENIVVSVNKKLASYKKISKVFISDIPLETTTTRKVKRVEVLKRIRNQK